MTLTYTYNGAAIAHNVAPSTASITSVAEDGEAAQSGLVIEDPAADLVTLGHRPFIIEESACAQPRLFTGWTTERGIGRIVEDGLHGDATARGHDVTVIDSNALFNFRLISGTDAKRPEETWAQRCAWILGSDYLTGLIADTGYIVVNTTTMDAADYTDGYPADVLRDLMDRSAGAYTYFAFWDVTAAAVGLWIGHVDDAVSDSTLRISNVVADIDSTTTFAPDPEAKLSVTPTETYSEVVVTYAHGTKRLFRSRPSTAATYIRRGTKIDRPYTGSEATASAQAERFLDQHATEQDRISVTIIVPASKVGLLTAGQRLDVKFSHLTNYTAFTSMRCVRLTVTPTDDTARYYSMALELLAARPSVVVAGSAVLYRSISDNLVYDYRVNNWTVVWDSNGDLAAGGWNVSPLAGPFEYVTSGAAQFSGLKCLGSGAVDIDCWATLGGSIPGGVYLDLKVNGTVVGTYGPVGAGWGPVDMLVSVAGQTVAAGDVITAYLHASGNVWPTSYGTNTTHLSVSGNLTAGGLDTEIILPPPPGAPITSASDPTVNDDVGDSYFPGQVWINTTTGEAFVLVDNTLGAAVWTSTTEVTPVGAPTTADFLVGTAQTGLSAEIVVGTTPGGELGGTWASPTVDATHSGSAHLALGSTSSTAAAGDHAHATTGELLVADLPAAVPVGTFVTTANQTVASTTTAYAVAFAAELDKHGLTHDNATNNSRIYIEQTGEYSILASAIAHDTTADKTHMDCWLAIDGTAVASSNTRVEIATKETEVIIAVQFNIDLTAGQYIELMYHGDATTLRFQETAAASTPTRPASPAVILTVDMIAPLFGVLTNGPTPLLLDDGSDFIYADV
jgi:hypothetical protein